MHAFFLFNMKTIISLRVLINNERICHPTHFGVQLIKATKVLEFVEIVALKVRTIHYICMNVQADIIFPFQFVNCHLDQLVMVMEQTIVQLLFATAN